jgi:hypothetical protein
MIIVLRLTRKALKKRHVREMLDTLLAAGHTVRLKR